MMRLSRPACAILVKSDNPVRANDGAAMPISQLVFFACWLVVALLSGAALVFVWQKFITNGELRK
jgi:hypothetical protein